MKYKVKQESELHIQFEKMSDRMIECNKQAFDLAKSLGFDALGVKKWCVAGGVSCFKYDGPKPPEGYKRVGKDHQNICYPKANNKDVLQKILELPLVTNGEYNGLINFIPQFNGNYYISRYSLSFVNGIYLIDTGEVEYTPVDGMEEILESEYKRLKEAK